ncbi:MAG: AMP-binding protein, partial [Bacteroidota bacterium]
QYDRAVDTKRTNVPIGQPIPNCQTFVLDGYGNQVPAGVIGELYLGGTGLAEGYWQQPELTAEQFITNEIGGGQPLYRTGDLVRWNLADNYYEYLGRKDQQVKIRGRRVELAEIESALKDFLGVVNGVVELRSRQRAIKVDNVHNCVSCGLPSNYPTANFAKGEPCHLCKAFTGYQEKVAKYFKTIPDLKALLSSVPVAEKGAYDCLMLLSGGKDSTYALAQLKELGFNVLAFTLDNGYISEGAKENIRRVCAELGVDQHFGETEAMNAIFVDSLQRHCNVCDGCFKTIYTLSVQLALEKNIPFIITGLSRGQFFETRLTEELFRQEHVDVDRIDEMILNARKAYHQVDDAVKQLLDVSMFEDESTFEKVRFVDFYRFTDVSLDEMYAYLNNRLPWVRRSTSIRWT